MANFVDEFNRSNYSSLGNNWFLKHKHDGSTTPSDSWKILSNGAVPKTTTSINVLAYRAGPYTAGSAVQFIWKIKPPAASGYSNNAECVFRYTATGGRGNDRLAVVLIGTTGTLQRRSWYWYESVQTQTTIATWTRTDTADYTITVDVSSADLVTVYDTNYTGAGSKAAELTSTVNAADTGFGMGSGFFDKVQINDLSVTQYAIFDGDDAHTRVKVDAQFEISDPASGDYPNAQQRMTAITVDPYIVLDGIPTDSVADLNLPTTVTSGSLTVSDTGIAPDPTSVGTGATTRWIAIAGSRLTSQWSPYVNNSGAGLYWSLASATDPVYDADFRYSSPHGILSRSALVFKGGASTYTNDYMRLAGFSGSRVASSWTFSMAMVLRSGDEAYYEIFSTDQTDGNLGAPLRLIYRHGMIYVELGSRVITHETARNESSPTIITVAVNNAQLLGRVLIQDLRRTYKEFSLKGADMAPRWKVGVFPITPISAAPHAQMDLFEVDYWNSFVTGAAMLRHNNLMSHIYGVVK